MPLPVLNRPLDPWLRTDEPLLWLGGAGHETVRSKSYYFDTRKRTERSHVCIQLTLTGRGFYRDARGQIDLPIGHAFCAVIPGEFEYGYLGPGDYELVHVSLVGPDAMRWYERLRQDFGPVLNLSHDATIPALMQSIAQASIAARLPDRYLMSAQLYQLLMTIYSALGRGRLSTSPRVTQAMAMIASRATDPSFNVGDLAEQLDCSREHLTRLFRAATGVSPSDYLTQQRLQHATRLLRSGEHKLEALARECGFSNANYFCRVFRQQVGTTPGNFRRQPWAIGP